MYFSVPVRVFWSLKPALRASSGPRHDQAHAPRDAAVDLRGAPAAARVPGHGERSRLQLFFKLAGTEKVALNVLAVQIWLFTVPPIYIVSKRVLYTLYDVKKCLTRSI